MSYLSVISSRLSECACGIEATLPSRGHSARTGCLAWRLGVDRPPRCRHPASATVARQRCRRPSRSGTAPPRVRRRKPKPPRGCPTQVSNEPRGGSSHGGSAGSRYSSSVPQQCRRIGTVVEPVRRSQQRGTREAGGWLRQAGDHVERWPVGWWEGVFVKLPRGGFCENGSIFVFSLLCVEII